MSAVKNLSIRLSAVGGDKVRQEFKNLGNDGDKAFRRITQVITPANDNLKALDATARSFNEVIRQGTALFGAYLGFQGLKNTFSSIFNANTTFERLSASLKTVTGSTKAAQEAFTLIEKFAINTPYQLNEIVEAFIRLKALGLDPSEEALTSYGNTASAFSKNMIDFVEAVADATVGEFERLKSFGIKANTLTDEVKFTFAGVTTTVKKNAADIEKYLRSLGDVNFAGAMDEQMKTMNGVLSNIEDSFEKIYRQIGQSGLNEALKSTFTQFNELVESGGSAADTIGNTLSEALKEAYASAPSDVVILHTLELRHPAFKDEKGNSTAIRVVRDNVNHICKLEDNAPLDGGKEVEFIALAFDLQLPPVENIPVPEISLSLDNVSTEIMRYLDQAIETQDMIEMTYRPYLSSDLSYPQMDPPITLVITEITADISKISATARMMDIGNKSFPAENYTVKKYPGLSR